MSRYRGPRIRILKKLGILPGFGRQLNQKFFLLSEQKKNETKKKKKFSYTFRLKEKQKLRYNYGLTEKSLMQYVKKARQKKLSTSARLLNSLEMRLDNIVFRLGFAPTIPAARQLIIHGHIFVNEKKRDIPSAQCQVNDTIRFSKKKNTIQYKNTSKILSALPNNFKKPEFVELDSTNSIGKIQRNLLRSDINLNINELLVLEYYSRNL